VVRGYEVIVNTILNDIVKCSSLLMSDCGLLLKQVLIIAETLCALYSQVLRMELLQIFM
jgi:hypothetical protein